MDFTMNETKQAVGGYRSIDRSMDGYRSMERWIDGSMDIDGTIDRSMGGYFLGDRDHLGFRTRADGRPTTTKRRVYTHTCLTGREP
jgi:hypothetical protein